MMGNEQYYSFCIFFYVFFVCRYQLFQVTPKDKTSYEAMVQLYKQSENYDFWIAPRGIDIAMDVMVPPAYVSVFTDLMDAYNMEYRVKMVDVQT